MVNFSCQHIIRYPSDILVSYNAGIIRKYMGNVSIYFDCNTCIHNYRNIKVR